MIDFVVRSGPGHIIFFNEKKCLYLFNLDIYQSFIKCFIIQKFRNLYLCQFNAMMPSRERQGFTPLNHYPLTLKPQNKKSLKTGILVNDTNQIKLKSATCFLYKLQSSTPRAHLNTWCGHRHSYVHHQVPPTP